MLLSWTITVHGQSTYPTIGEPCPDFYLKSIEDYSQTSISLSELKGRHVIIDLWHRHCSACIASFPKINALHEKYKDRIDFFMVGLEDKQGLESLYRQAKEQYKLTVPWVIDSALYYQLNGVRSAPHLIWIDDQGMVRAVTVSITAEQLDLFVKNESFQFKDASYQAKQNSYSKDLYTIKRPFMVEGNGGTGYDIRYRSLLLDYIPNQMPSFAFPSSIKHASKLFETYGTKLEGVVDLPTLYKFAYFGRWSWNNSLDTTRFGDKSVYQLYYRTIQYDLKADELALFNVDDHTGKNKYLYSLVLPHHKTDEKGILEIIQKDLYLNFGFKAMVEMKQMPYWSMQIDKETMQTIRSRSEKRHYDNYTDVGLHVFTNWPIEKLIEMLFKNIYTTLPPIINETGFTGNVDITIEDGLLSDFERIKVALEKNGIRLVESTRLFKVLAIKSIEE